MPPEGSPGVKLPKQTRLSALAIVGAFAALVIFVLAFTHGSFLATSLPRGDWGDTRFLITVGNTQTYVFADGAVLETSTAVERIPRAEIIPELKELGVVASSNPDDYQVVLSGDVRVPAATDPQIIAGTDMVAVRTKNNIQLCDVTGDCSTLYSFGKTIAGAVPFAVTANALAVADPLSQHIQIFALDTDARRITPRNAFLNPVLPAQAMVFDPRREDRLVFLTVSDGLSQEVEASNSQVPEGASRGFLPTVRLAVCALDGVMQPEHAEPLCTYSDIIGTPNYSTISVYE